MMSFDRMGRWRRWLVAAGAVVLGLAGTIPAQAAESVASLSVGASGANWAPHVQYSRLQLRVSGPNGFFWERSFDASTNPSFAFANRSGLPLADGTYRYELSVVPEGTRTRGDNDTAATTERAASGAVQSGYVVILDGQGVQPGQAEPARARAPQPDTTFTDSLCVGFDCPASPSFSDTTILMMENNTRIKFDDTSASAGFPNRDWAINANDSASGGQNRFWVQDCGTSSQGGCSGNAVFTVEAGARANALYVDDGGRLGLGTSTPVLDIHDKRSNTPSLRLEQDSTGGFTAQTWDIAGNEANFFVRDVTAGSRLPFRIRPGAPTSSVDIAASGNVGMGTASPSAALHVRRTDGTGKILNEDTAASGDKVMLHLNSSASSNKVRFLYQAGTKIWSLDNNGGQDTFSIAKVGGGNLTIDAAGNVTTTGTVNGVSDRNAKTDIVDVDPQAVLAKVAELPIATWRYKQAHETHMGPMAQDFAASFGLGADDKHIALNDLSGVALAAIKALNQTVAAKDARLEALERQNTELASQNAGLAERLAAIEAALAAHE